MLASLTTTKQTRYFIMAKKSIPSSRTVLVPAAMLLSGNGFTMPAGNSFTFDSGLSISEGDLLVCDRDRLPARGDVVVMMRKGRKPFARQCDIPPFDVGKKKWSFGHCADDEMYLFNSEDFALIGVVTGWHDNGGDWHTVSDKIATAAKRATKRKGARKAVRKAA
ncbi:MAG: hypothetical protein QM741_13435 [Rudaea sp.]|uniref:hypothetical protein n=1 Tax=Rudaea sp. TaxID=2136325 RepID=UPI0039E37582